MRSATVRLSTPRRDQDLDRVFDEAGFTVVSSEELPLDEQLALVADATVVAGSSGSALHLSAFAPPSAQEVAAELESCLGGDSPA